MYKALKRACRNVRWKTSVTQFELNGLKNSAKAIQEIESEKYKLSKYQEFEIYEPKHRHITATRIKDRQIQRSMCDNYFYEAITKSFIYDNCACLKGKGTLFATDRLKQHFQKYWYKHRSNDGWVLKCDIHHFFDSIDHDIAKQVVTKRVPNDHIKQMIFDIIDSFGDVGIGLGSQVSQLIALAYLDDLDHYIKEQLHIKHYVRYMDDFILIHEDKEYLKYCLKKITEHITAIKLELNSKTTIQPLNKGIMFLHWKYILTDTGKVILLPDKQRLTKKRKKLKKMREMCKQNQITFDHYKQSVSGMIAHLKQGNAHNAICELRHIFRPKALKW